MLPDCRISVGDVVGADRWQKFGEVAVSRRMNLSACKTSPTPVENRRGPFDDQVRNKIFVLLLEQDEGFREQA